MTSQTGVLGAYSIGVTKFIADDAIEMINEVCLSCYEHRRNNCLLRSLCQARTGLHDQDSLVNLKNRSH
jgi:hypothetical protein